jgi:hypothetical protein
MQKGEEKAHPDYAPNSALFRDQSQTEQEYTSAGFT